MGLDEMLDGVVEGAEENTESDVMEEVAEESNETKNENADESVEGLSLEQIFGADDVADETEDTGIEEDVLPLKRAGFETGARARGTFKVAFNGDDTVYDEILVEKCNEVQRALYEGLLISREGDYRIKFHCLNSKVVEFPHYRISDKKLEKGLLKILAQGLEQIAESDETDLEFTINLSACL